MKKCYKCSKMLSESNFGMDNRTPDGLKRACRECRAKEAAEGSQKPGAKEKKNARQRAYRKKFPDKRFQMGQSWRDRNKERIAWVNGEWVRNNRAKVRDYQLKKKYGIPHGTYKKMYEHQGGMCAICGRKPGELKLYVDHCHKTGVIRGLLCRECNAGIGFLKDSVELCKQAEEYLSTKIDWSRILGPGVRATPS